MCISDLVTKFCAQSLKDRSLIKRLNGINNVSKINSVWQIIGAGDGSVFL